MAARRSPFVAVLAGGSGTRFWPAGRQARPKQVLALDGDDPRSLLDLTLRRLRLLVRRPARVIAPLALRRVLTDCVPDHDSEGWLWEPAPRNTAPAVALAAFAAAAESRETPVLIVPADHHVEPQRAYVKALRAMVQRATEVDAIVTLGLRPDRPATGYGYLRLGAATADSAAGPVHTVARFVEKPPLSKAKRMAKDGKHLWNGGTFAFRAGVFLDELERQLPETFGPLAEAFGSYEPARPTRPAFQRRLTAAYEAVRSISVDYGVMENAGAVETVAATLEWDDLGSWDAVARHRAADGAGNRVRGDVTLVDTRDCVVEAQDGHVALLGVEDLIVVRTGDTVLVTRRGKGERVREVVNALREGTYEDLI